jgi:hypothetical protein
MRAAIIAVAVASVLAACTERGSPIAPIVSPTPAPGAATLLARPLKLPAVRPGASCPVTPVANRKVDVANPRGHGPFYLGGPVPQGQFPWNKTPWILVDGARGPVLFRGGRVDGTGSFKFSGSRADRSEKGVSLSSGGGVSVTFYERVIDAGTEDALFVYPATAGCYALQVDGPSFQDVIVLAAA